MRVVNISVIYALLTTFQTNLDEMKVGQKNLEEESTGVKLQCYISYCLITVHSSVGTLRNILPFSIHFAILMPSIKFSTTTSTLQMCQHLAVSWNTLCRRKLMVLRTSCCPRIPPRTKTSISSSPSLEINPSLRLVVVQQQITTAEQMNKSKTKREKRTSEGKISRRKGLTIRF